MGGLGPMGFQQKVMSLQYANDILLFSYSEDRYIRTLKFLLYVFKLASGLKINFNKSFVIV